MICEIGLLHGSVLMSNTSDSFIRHFKQWIVLNMWRNSFFSFSVACFFTHGPMDITELTGTGRKTRWHSSKTSCWDAYGFMVRQNDWGSDCSNPNCSIISENPPPSDMWAVQCGSCGFMLCYVWKPGKGITVRIFFQCEDSFSQIWRKEWREKDLERRKELV